MDVVVGLVAADVGRAGIAEGADVGLEASVGAGAVGGELDVVVLRQAILDAADAEHAVGVGGGDDGLPLAVVALVAGAVADEDALAGGEVAGTGHIGGAVHVGGVVAFLAVAEGGGDDVGAVLVGPFHSHLPPDFLLEGFGVDLGAGQEELGAGGQAEVDAVHAAGDAGEGHGAVGIPAVDVLFVFGEVPGFDDLMVVAQVAEGFVGVDTGEAAVEHGDAHPASVDAFVAEGLAAHAYQLGLEGTVDGGDVEEAVERVGVVAVGQLKAVALDGLHTEHIGQGLDGQHLVGRGHDAEGVHPAAGADFLGGQGADALLVGGADGIVGDVVEVGATLLVALDSLGIEIGIGVEGGARLVGEEHPVGLLGRGGDEACQGEGQDCDVFFHVISVLYVIFRDCGNGRIRSDGAGSRR